ncbi:reprolysin-like metallopeptidase [Colwelliaceae bacterium BS250]
MTYTQVGFFIFALLLNMTTAVSAFAQTDTQLWQDINNQSNTALNQNDNPDLNQTETRASKFTSVRLNHALLQDKLKQPNPRISLPMPDGKIITIELTKVSILPASLAAKYPQISSFKGVQLDNNDHFGRFDYSEQGFHGLLNYKGKVVYIDPSTHEGDQYISYFKQDALSTNKHIEQQVLSNHKGKMLLTQKSIAEKSEDVASINKTYRIAFSTTGEYSQFHGGTKESVLAAITTLVNRLNQVFEIDLGITLQLAENSDEVIFLDPATDDFTNTDEDIYINPEVQAAILDTNFFDVGHVLTTGAGGLAVVGGTCDEGPYQDFDDNNNVIFSTQPIKSMGVTGSISPVNDSFYIDFVAHELGHQFGATHSFNSESNICSGSTRSAGTAYEPGSGSTIMSYAGLCAPENIQNNADSYFHVKSIEQIKLYLVNDPYQIGQSCGLANSSDNVAPQADAGQDYTIPANTPFSLTANASDNNNDLLTYTWEQVDLGAASTSFATMQDDGFKPLFRSYLPNASASRTFPLLESILSGELVIGENYATTTRQLNFQISVRDNQGAVVSDQVTLQVDGDSGPFVILTPTSATVWENQLQSTITWDVANTDIEPINCQWVNIDLSTDSGQIFDLSLATNIANNGQASINASSVNSLTARLKVSCSDNIFFTVSSADFQIINNAVPTAVDDNFNIGYQQQELFDVLANDHDNDVSNTLEITSVEYSGAAVVFIENNKINYQAAEQFTGVDTFIYFISDGEGGSASANVTVRVASKDKKSSGSFFWLIILSSIVLISKGKPTCTTN